MEQLIHEIAPGDRQAFRNQIESLSGGQPIDFDCLTTSGRLLHTFSVPQVRDGETFIRLVTCDLTAIEIARPESRAAEENDRFLAEALPIHICTGEGKTIDFANQHLLDFTGLSLEQIQAGDIFRLIHPDDRDWVIAAVSHSMEAGQLFTLEYRLRRVDGQYRWHLAQSSQTRDRDGNLKWFAIAIDITDRKMAEEKLLGVNQRLSLALATAQMGDWEWNVDTGAIWWSDMVHHMHGFDPGTFDGRFETWLGTVHPDDRPSVLEAISLATASAERYEVEYRTLHPSGSIYWTHARAVIDRHADGTPQRWLGVCMDITARKMSEDAMQRAEKLAAVGRLAASIAHEINNPLESVTNLLFIVAAHHDLPPSLKGYLETAQSELARVTQIATQTLRFYRQSSGPTLTDVSALIDSVLSLFQGRLALANVEIIREYRLRQHLLCLDGELRQAVTNLIGNALDSMAARGGRLIIRTSTGRNKRTGDATVRITIADTGVGITRHVRQRLFQPFFTTKATGTGLGLWITQELVRKQGGRIFVRSKVDRGTVFTLTLPATGISVQAVSSVR